TGSCTSRSFGAEISTSNCGSPIAAWDFRLAVRTASSSPSSPRSPRGSGWDLRSGDPLRRRTVAVCGARTIFPAAPRFICSCRPTRRTGRMRPSIAIVDDEEHVRVALRRLCDAYGLHARTFASAQQLLDSLDDALPHCLILDVQMPGLGGLDA